MADEPRFCPRRFAHANLFISDVRQSMDFYGRIAGLEELFQEPAIHAGFMGNGNTHHDVSVTQVSEESLIGRAGQVLVPPEFGRKPDLFHIAFEMENEAELVAAHDRAVRYGVTIVMTADHTFAKSVYLLDAERNLLEFTSDSTSDWRATYRELEGQLVTGPWTPGELEPTTERNYAPDPEIRRTRGVAVHSRRTTHAVLGCRNLDEQVAFYREVGGLETVVCSERVSDGRSEGNGRRLLHRAVPGARGAEAGLSPHGIRGCLHPTSMQMWIVWSVRISRSRPAWTTPPNRASSSAIRMGTGSSSTRVFPSRRRRSERTSCVASGSSPGRVAMREGVMREGVECHGSRVR